MLGRHVGGVPITMPTIVRLVASTRAMPSATLSTPDSVMIVRGRCRDGSRLDRANRAPARAHITR